MLTIIGTASQVMCPDPTNSGIVNTDGMCTECSYVYTIRRVRKDVTTVQCLFDEGEDIYEEV